MKKELSYAEARDYHRTYRHKVGARKDFGKRHELIRKVTKSLLDSGDKVSAAGFLSGAVWETSYSSVASIAGRWGYSQKEEDATVIRRSKTWFTADHHFGCKEIIDRYHRPFSNVAVMDATMIERWNAVVGKNDVVYHLGDFTSCNYETAKRYFSALKGKIRILKNEHHYDKRWLILALASYEIEIISGSGHPVGFIDPITEIEKDVPIVLCHFPMSDWNGKQQGAWHLFGHGHVGYTPPAEDNAWNVGVDNWNFYPVALWQIKEKNT